MPSTPFHLFEKLRHSGRRTRGRGEGVGRRGGRSQGSANVRCSALMRCTGERQGPEVRSEERAAGGSEKWGGATNARFLSVLATNSSFFLCVFCALFFFFAQQTSLFVCFFFCVGVSFESCPPPPPCRLVTAARGGEGGRGEGGQAAHRGVRGGGPAEVRGAGGAAVRRAARGGGAGGGGLGRKVPVSTPKKPAHHQSGVVGHISSSAELCIDIYISIYMNDT